MSGRAYRVSMTLAYVAFTAAIATVLRGNPFGEGTISWLAAVAVAAGGNALLAFALAPRVGPYLAGSGQRYLASAPAADTGKVRAATLATAVTTMAVSLLCVWAVGLTASDPIIVPTKRLEQNAKLSRATIKAKAPAEFQGTIGAADTWRVDPDDDVFRTCVPAKDHPERAWCVRIEATDTSARVLDYGPGKPNAEEFLDRQGSGAAPAG
jgi:hypothetical protein